MRRRKFFIKLTCATALACLICIGLNPAALAESDKLTVRVMTRNMDAGTDLNYLTEPGADLSVALTKTLAEVYASNIPARATQLAAEILAAKPDLIALQEVSNWTIPTEAGPLVLDQLQALKSALVAGGQHYSVVMVQPLFDIQAFGARFTDNNAILIRSDLPPGHLDVLGSEMHQYTYFLSFTLPYLGEIDVPNGWMAVDVKMRGARFKFANTHLLSPVPLPGYFEPTSQLQQLQAGELLTGLGGTSLPVILAGDFNSDANGSQTVPDHTPTAGIISSSGYTDAWHYKHPGDPGQTWPLFFEDQLATVPTAPFERIDLIFSRGPVPLTVEQTGTGVGPAGVFASDHVGVVAEFDLENHRPEVPKGKTK